MSVKQDLVAVWWNRPKSVYHDVVQYISPSLISERDDDGHTEICLLYVHSGKEIREIHEIYESKEVHDFHDHNTHKHE